VPLKIVWIFLFVSSINICFAQQNLKLISPAHNTFFSEINGEIWIATAGKGFNRYRGIDTQHYLLNDNKSGLQGSFIQSALYEDDKGCLWTSTYENICYYDPTSDQFTSFKAIWQNDTLKSGYHILGYNKSTKALIFRAEEALYQYDILNQKISHSFGKTIGNFYYFSPDTIMAAPWLKGSGLELWTREENTYTKKYYDFAENKILKNRKITKVLMTQNQWWLLTDDGLVKFDPTAENSCELFKYNKLQNDIMADGIVHNQFILITSDYYGVLVFDTKSEQFIKRKAFERLRSDHIYCDRYNRLWLSHASEGIETYPINQILSFDKNPEDDIIFNHIEFKDRLKIFISQSKGILIKKDGESRFLKVNTKSLPIKSVIKAKVIDEKNILIYDLFNVYNYHWNSQKIKKIEFPNIRQIEDLNSIGDTIIIICDSDVFGYKWPTLQEIGLGKINKYNGQYQLFFALSPEMITFSHASTQYAIFSPKKDTSIDVGSFIYNAAYDHTTQNHYLATENGLFLLDQQYHVKSLTNFTPILQNRPIQHIIQSPDFAYFVANNMVCRIHKKTEKIDIFDQWAFRTSPGIGLDYGKITIASDNIDEMPIEDAFVSENKYNLILDYVKVNQVNRNLSDLIKLTHDENSLKWRLYVTDYLHPDANKIGYRITPSADTIWHFIENGQEIELSYLAPNNYSIQVKAYFANGEVSPINNYSFNILNPWYKSWWFYISTIVCTIIIGLLLYRKRIKSIQEKHAIEKEITNLQRSALQAQMNPHFIFNCLNSIQNYIMQNEKLDAMEYLNLFAQLVRQNLNASNSNTISLQDEINMLQNYLTLEQMRTNQTFDFSITVDIQIDKETTEIPPLLIQPFVENAILHGVSGLNYQGVITVDFLKEASLLIISVSDNGKGIDNTITNTEHRSLGMTITQKRLQFAQTSADSNIVIGIGPHDIGTKVVITLDL